MKHGVFKDTLKMGNKLLGALEGHVQEQQITIGDLVVNIQADDLFLNVIRQVWVIQQGLRKLHKGTSGWRWALCIAGCMAVWAD
jgi:hypothetical protein